MVASTSTRLINRLPVMAAFQQQDEPGSAAQAESEEEEEECEVREKTPDTNVKLNQPLRCGRYGQDLISHKERQNSGTMHPAQGQKPGLGAGRKVDPALIASRQSTTAPPVAPIRAAPVVVAEPQAQGSATQVLPRPVTEPSQQPAPAARGPAATTEARAAPRSLVPTSVDDLLTGPAPVAPIMTASMAGSAAAMAESVAALVASTAADREAAKAALGQHYRQYRAKKAAAEQRNSLGGNRPVGTSGRAAPAAAVATPAAPGAMPVNRGSDAGPSTRHHQSGAVPDHRHHRSESHGAAGAAHAVADIDDEVPLRVKYGTSSSGSSSRGSWQNTAVAAAQRQDTATTSLYPQQQQQQQGQLLGHSSKLPRPQKKSNRPAGMVHGESTKPQQARRETGHHRHASAVSASQSTLVVAGELHRQMPAADSVSQTQSAALEDVEIQVATTEAEDVRKSNDKLDMLLQSTVKRSQQGVIGKENQVSGKAASLHVCCLPGLPVLLDDLLKTLPPQLARQLQ